MAWRIALALIGVAVLSASTVDAQPALCSHDTDCEGGFYCDGESFNCRECLSCENLKREPPRYFSKCIRSVADCGDCIKGLVEDHTGDVSFVCVPPDKRADEDGVPAYVWAPAVAVALLLLAVLVLVIVYLLRNTYTFKILASTRTSVQSPCGGSMASAPELPPPYDAPAPAPYNPQYTASTPPRDPETPVREDDSSWPFIKRVPSERGAGAEAREAAGHQAARVFKYPRYVRAPHLPPTYKNPSMSDESESTFTVHDEDTMESTWTPTPGADHTDTNGNAVTSGPLALVPAATHVPHGPHAAAASHAPIDTDEPHALCARQDSNNNSNPGESTMSGPSAGGSGAPSVVINLVTNFTAVQQHNDVTL